MNARRRLTASSFNPSQDGMKWRRFTEPNLDVLLGPNDSDEEEVVAKFRDIVKKYLKKDITKCWYLEGHGDDDASTFINGAVTYCNSKKLPEFASMDGARIWLVSTEWDTLHVINPVVSDFSFAIRA